MVKFLKSNNSFFLGLFLLIWSMNSYFVFGPIGRYFYLSLGFILMFLPCVLGRFSNSSSFFLIKISFIYFFLVVIGVFNDQNSISFQNIIFGIVCVLLSFIGFYISKSNLIFEEINKWVFLISFICTLVSFYFIIDYLNTYSLSQRDFDQNDIINPVGLAFTNGLLFLYFFSILIFSKDWNIKVLSYIALFFSLIIIFTTQSRGVLIFIFLSLVIFYFYKIKISLKLGSFILKFSFFLFCLTPIIWFFKEQFNILNYRFEALINRFELLLSFKSGETIDPSSLERQAYFSYFYKNIDKFFPFGENNYQPYPHNFFLEGIMRWGLLGFILSLIIVYVFIFSIRYTKLVNYNYSVLFSLLSLLFIFSFLQSLTSLSLEMNRTLWLGFGFFCGISKGTIKYLSKRF